MHSGSGKVERLAQHFRQPVSEREERPNTHKIIKFLCVSDRGVFYVSCTPLLISAPEILHNSSFGLKLQANRLRLPTANYIVSETSRSDGLLPSRRLGKTHNPEQGSGDRIQLAQQNIGLEAGAG